MISPPLSGRIEAVMPKKSLRNFETAQLRRKYLEDKFKITLNPIGQFSFAENSVTGRNIENLIGSVHIPLGVAGPLKIKDSTYKDCYIPLATTEGALVASIQRGCKAINLSGGAIAETENFGVTRAPVFKTKGARHATLAKEWIELNFDKIAKISESTSHHLKLLRIETNFVGTNLFVRFSFDSQDAMGMNMATIATDSAVKFIEKGTKVSCISLAGNFDIDKKAAWLNVISGRGRRVWSEVVLPKAVVKKVLKTTPEKIHDLVIRKCQIGSIMSGAIGFNAHFANIIAAIFIATGQDIAHVVEGSMGITSTELLPSGDLYFSIYLPSLLVGTVGGGTNLPSQRECLELMGINKEGAMVKFARIIGASVLAGELSLIASQAEGSLAHAHRKHGRNEK
jgi:hydroxymethylglutaryl-CoA reductase (NADPH)